MFDKIKGENFKFNNIGFSLVPSEASILIKYMWQ